MTGYSSYTILESPTLGAIIGPSWKQMRGISGRKRHSAIQCGALSVGPDFYLDRGIPGILGDQVEVIP